MWWLGWWPVPVALAIIGFAGALIFGHVTGSMVKFRTVLGKAAGNSVPIGYVLGMVLFVYLFDTHCLPLVRSPAHQIFIRLNYSPPFLIMAWMVWSNPGRITRANHQCAVNMFPYDRILFMPDKECRTCGFARPARSKHCGACGACIAMCDHHCVWINNCIGLGNARWFLLFLVIHAYFFTYGLILSVWIVWTFVKRYWEGELATGQKLVGALLGDDASRVAVCTTILCVSLLTIVIMFAAFHFHFIHAGVSTYEADKWETVHWLLTERQLYVYKPGGGHIVLQRLTNGHFNRGLTPEELAWVDSQPVALVPATGWSDLTNIYDHGFWQNLKLLLFPPRLD